MDRQGTGSEDPAIGQTEKSIGAYLEGCAPGDPVAIHDCHEGWLRIRLTTVAGVNPRLGRLYTEHRGRFGKAWYRRTGRDCWHPKGPAHLVEPTAAVRAHAEAHPLGAPAPERVASLHGTDSG